MKALTKRTIALLLCITALMSFSAAFAVPVTMDELGARAAAVKKFAKSKPGNSYVRDRRAPLGLPEAEAKVAAQA